MHPLSVYNLITHTPCEPSRKAAWLEEGEEYTHIERERERVSSSSTLLSSVV